jgi:hypothetical protein
LAFNGDLSLKKKQVLSLEKNKPGLSMTWRSSKAWVR